MKDQSIELRRLYCALDIYLKSLETASLAIKEAIEENTELSPIIINNLEKINSANINNYLAISTIISTVKECPETWEDHELLQEIGDKVSLIFNR